MPSFFIPSALFTTTALCYGSPYSIAGIAEIINCTHSSSPVQNLDLPPLWPSAPYGPMDKLHHPCYTNVNPAAEAPRYTSERVCCRKVTLIYDWLPPDREVESWFRRVPYRLERVDADDSWIVKYFEFRAGIAPLPQMGFIGDLWISWNAGDPSVWFKVEETQWERWGGCASSVREVSLRALNLLRIAPCISQSYRFFSLYVSECGTTGIPSSILFFFFPSFLRIMQQMNAKHPFLDKAYLWFSPRDFFFVGKLPDAKLSLRWDRSPRIRRVAPCNRIIDPDSSVLPKKVPVHPVYLPSMRTIVRTLCPNMHPLRQVPPVTPAPVSDTVTAVASTSGVQIQDLRGPFPMEEIVLGDDVEIDWDWWGSSRFNVPVDVSLCADGSCS